MPLAELINGRIELETDPYRDKVLVKEVPGRKYDGERRLWWVPLSWASCVALRGVFGDELEIGPTLNAWAMLELHERIKPALDLRDQLHPLVTPEWFDDWAKDLYDFQVPGAAFLTVAQHALLADEMRLGKTIQVVAALRAKGVERALVIAPNSVKRGWRAEFRKWWPEIDVQVYQPGAKGKKAIEAVRDRGGVLIVNWENTYRLSKLAPFGAIKLTDKEREPKQLNWIDWDAVVADEAHRMKEPRAKQTRATWALMQGAPFRVALTGTPVANSPRDLWSIMHGLEPNEYASYTAFVDRYGLKSWNAFGGLEVVGLSPATRDEFFRFFDPRFIRRTRDLVRPDLPPKSYSRRYVTLTTKQKKLYQELVKESLAELESGDLVWVTNQIVKNGRLRQVTCAYVELDPDDPKHWRLVEPSSKLDELMAVLEEAGTEQVAVYAEHRDLIDLAALRLEKADIPFGMITGKVDEEDRQTAVDEFQAGKLRAILCTYGAGGEGITLSAARILVRLERTYSTIKDIQTEDRGIDLNSPDLEIIDILAEDTVDERVFLALEEKGERLQEVCRDEDRIRRLLGAE